MSKDELNEKYKLFDGLDYTSIDKIAIKAQGKGIYTIKISKKHTMVVRMVIPTDSYGYGVFEVTNTKLANAFKKEQGHPYFIAKVVHPKKTQRKKRK